MIDPTTNATVMRAKTIAATTQTLARIAIKQVAVLLRGGTVHTLLFDDAVEDVLLNDSLALLGAELAERELDPKVINSSYSF